MPKFFSSFVFILFVVFNLPTQVLANGNEEVIYLGKSCEYLEDKQRTMTFEQVSKEAMNEKFRAFPQDILNLSTTTSAVWLKFDLAVQSDKRYYIQIDNSDLDSVFFYFPTATGAYNYKVTGKNFPISTESIASTHCIIEVPQSDIKEAQTYYIRLTSKRYIIVDIKAISQNKVLNTLLQRYMIELIFFGVVLLAALYNLFVFLAIRDISYLYYVIYSVLIGLNIANIRGYLGLFIPQWRGEIVTQYSFLSGALYIPFITLFTISFLKVKQYSPWTYRGLMALLFISILHIITNLLGFGGVLFKALHTFLLVNVACYVFTGWVIYRKGYKPAGYFLASWGIFAIFTTIAVMAYTNNFIPFTSFSKYYTPLGAMLETIISALGLANRINILKEEKEELQKEHITYIEQQKELLEQKVNERTLELNVKTSEIEIQNAELKQYQHELLAINELLSQSNDLIKSQHDEINALNKDLEQRIIDRTTELQHTLDNLTKQNQDLEHFSYIISHNIRSPIARIQGLLNIFNKEKFDDEFNKQVIKHLEQATDSLDTVIKDLTQIISIRKNLNKVKEEIDIVEMIEAELFFFHDEITNANAIIKKNIEVSKIFSIKSYIQNIIHNLLSNAIKYRNPRQQLCISIHIYQSLEFIILSVKDNGLGIDIKNTDLYKIFGLYQRMHTHIDGKGLGLYLVKTQVETLKGKILVESKPNEGAIFTVSFPLESEI
jgi:signal transduction histidine kinase